MVRKSFILGALILLTLTSCNLSPERARIELARKYIEYSPESFIKAAQNNDERVVDLFIKAGMDVNSQDAIGRTALIEATKMGHIDLVKVLVKQGADQPAIPFQTRNVNLMNEMNIFDKRGSVRE